MAVPDPQEWKRKDQVDRLLSHANYYRMRRDIDRLEEVCQQILQLDPSNLLAREWIADVLHERGRLDEAAAAYKELLK